MTAIQIRDVPTEVRDQLAVLARARGQSLSAYLRDVIIREARFAKNVRLIDEVSTWQSRRDFTIDDILAARDADRPA